MELLMVKLQGVSKQTIPNGAAKPGQNIQGNRLEWELFTEHPVVATTMCRSV